MRILPCLVVSEPVPRNKEESKSTDPLEISERVDSAAKFKLEFKQY